jgi:hypothetical protein
MVDTLNHRRSTRWLGRAILKIMQVRSEMIALSSSPLRSSLTCEHWMSGTYDIQRFRTFIIYAEQLI